MKLTDFRLGEQSRPLPTAPGTNQGTNLKQTAEARASTTKQPTPLAQQNANVNPADSLSAPLNSTSTTDTVKIVLHQANTTGDKHGLANDDDGDRAGHGNDRLPKLVPSWTGPPMDGYIIWIDPRQQGSSAEPGHEPSLREVLTSGLWGILASGSAALVISYLGHQFLG